MNVHKSYNILDVFYSTSTICDADGNLLIQSDGCKIADFNDQIIPGSNNLNIGSIGYLISCPDYGHTVNGSFILPRPGYPDEYYLFYQELNDFGSSIGLHVDTLQYAKIVHDTLADTLDVPFTNRAILQQHYLTQGSLTACRHANGRDWWLLQPQENGGGYHRVLVSPDTIQDMGLQEDVGTMLHPIENGWGSACFSPDGTKYVRYQGITDVQLFDFDRTTGELSNSLQIPIDDLGDSLLFNFMYSPGFGVSFSPNSRYLYVTSTIWVYQYDLCASDVPSSRVTVAEYDGSFVDPGYPLTFSHMQIGPDGRIYFNAPGAIECIHVIEEPDSAGLACNVVQHKYILDYPISGGWPYFPNFRLGPGKAALPCENAPLAEKEPVLPDVSIKVSPNPADQEVLVDITTGDYARLGACTLELYSTAGANCGKWLLHAYSPLVRVDVGGLPNGIYLFVLKEGVNWIETKRMVVLH